MFISVASIALALSHSVSKIVESRSELVSRLFDYDFPTNQQGSAES